MRTEHARIKIILLLAGLLLVFSAAAQEQSIRPGINRHFVDPDWQQWVNVFERTGREVYDKRHAIVAASKVRPGMAVADIGAGTGLFTRLFSAAVEPGGTVYAIDISSTFIDNILRTCREQGLTNVTGIVNTPFTIGLPADSIDLAFVRGRLWLPYTRRCAAMAESLSSTFVATRVSALTGLWNMCAATRPRSFRNCMKPASGLWMTNP